MRVLSAAAVAAGAEAPTGAPLFASFALRFGLRVAQPRRWGSGGVRVDQAEGKGDGQDGPASCCFTVVKNASAVTLTRRSCTLCIPTARAQCGRRS